MNGLKAGFSGVGIIVYFCYSLSFYLEKVQKSSKKIQIEQMLEIYYGEMLIVKKTEYVL